MERSGQPRRRSEVRADFRNNPVGTGPFIFREWKSRDQIVLDANPTYWNGKPKLDRIVFKVYPESQAALLALQRGETQIMGMSRTSVIPALRADPNIMALTQPGLAVNGMAMPNDTPPLDDKRVRQALNYAVDKQAIIKALYGGLAVPMVSPLPEAQWGFDKSLKGYPYDPAKAKQLLEQAGAARTEDRVAELQHPARLQPGGVPIWRRCRVISARSGLRSTSASSTWARFSPASGPATITACF